MARRILLVVNPTKPEANAAAREVSTLIARHGSLVAELPADAAPHHFARGSIDLIVVIGGDGTLIAQSRRFASLGVPMLGVNMGRLGFLAEFDLDSLRPQAESLFGTGRLLIRSEPMLRVDTRHAHEHEFHLAALALNEVVITSGPPYRMITVALSVDAVPGPSINGDGLIVSTALGSTAYNLSAGGPILAPGVDALAITPIAAHSLSVRPVIVPGRSIVEITIIRSNHEDEGHGSALILDGEGARLLRDNDRVRICFADSRVSFVENPVLDYWKRLISKLNWSAPPKLER